MKVINMTKGNDNPFYGRVELLELLNLGNSNKVEKYQFLSEVEKAYHSLKSEDDRKLFYVILFAFGDIPNRQHNIFGKAKIDGGGSGMRSLFRWVMEWMLEKGNQGQFNKFMQSDLFRQYTCLFNLLANQVKTQKGTIKVVESVNMLNKVDVKKLADYLAQIIQNGSPVDKQIIAKWLVYPRTSKRQKRSKKGEVVKGGRALQVVTRQNMAARVLLYNTLSDKMKWPVKQHKHNLEFVGLRAWKKEFNGTLESVLFSTGKVKELDKEQFFNWLNIVPAGARFRVRRRLLGKDNKLKEKWINKDGLNLGNWFLNWENFKESKQKEERVLTEKVRQGTASEKEKKQLETTKKEAKVTTGGNTLFDILNRMVSGVADLKEAELLASSLLEKTEFKVPVLAIADVSGSMKGIPNFMAQTITTLVMLKNPSNEIDNVLVTFGEKAVFITDKSIGVQRQNRFMQGSMKQVDVLIDRNKSFIENLKNIQLFVSCHESATNFSTVSIAFKNWVESVEDGPSKQVRIEMIQQFPVFLVISDGDFNNQSNASQCMAEFQQNMRQWFGWEGVVVLWDVKEGRMEKSQFESLPNVIHFRGWNISVVNQIFTKIHDLDVIDVFTPLKSLYMSNRYDLVKQSVL